MGQVALKDSGFQSKNASSLMMTASVLGLWTLAEDNESYLKKHYTMFGDLEKIKYTICGYFNRIMHF